MSEFGSFAVSGCVEVDAGPLPPRETVEEDDGGAGVPGDDFAAVAGGMPFEAFTTAAGARPIGEEGAGCAESRAGSGCV